MHFIGKLGLEKVSARPSPLDKTFFNLHFECQQNNNLSVFNVQTIRLCSIGSWNGDIPEQFQNLSMVLSVSPKGLRNYNTGYAYMDIIMIWLMCTPMEIRQLPPKGWLAMRHDFDTCMLR